MKTCARIFLVTLMVALLASCDYDAQSTTCDVTNPTEELPWLKTMIESWEANSTIYIYMYIQQGIYEGQTVFLVGNCCPFCDSYFPVFNCSGEELEGVNIQEIMGLKTIWKPADSECTI